MNSQNTIFLYKAERLIMALMISLLLIPATQLDLYAQAPAGGAYVELDAVQLDQLVAPIALDPDSLVAQILTAATYPDQVAAADTWWNQNLGLPPDQRAAGADAMDWDPAVKGLTAFPSVLDNLAKNGAWTAQLGNAYYNQPGDVMNAVQAMRLQAQQSNVLVTNAQERVVVDAGVIDIVPVNPAVVYVPYYNPWRVWGGLFVAYPGFVELPPPPGIVWGAGIGFAAGISVGAYAGFGWGFGAWAPAWDGGTVMFGGDTYISNSMSVYNHGDFGGHDRGAFDHGGRGVPGGFHGHAHAGEAHSRGGHAGGGHGASASHGGSAGHGAPASHGASAGHGASASHGGSAGHGAPASHGASAGHGAPASHGASGGGHGGAPASHGASGGGHGAPASHGASGGGHGAPASHGASGGGHGAPAGHSGGGGHAAPSGAKKGKGK